MLPQLAFSKGCIITLATSVYFSPLCIPLRHTHIGCICITCLHYVLSFVWFFSTLSFQMCLQAFCPIGYKITLVTHMSQTEENSQLLHLFDFTSLSVFTCFLNLPSPKDAKSHWLHLVTFFPLCIPLRHTHIGCICIVSTMCYHLFDFSPLWVFKCAFKPSVQ